MESEITYNLGGVPERFKKEGIFIHNRQKARIGSRLRARKNRDSLQPGTILTVKDIIVEARGNERGFDKFLVFEEIKGLYKPGNFELIREDFEKNNA